MFTITTKSGETPPGFWQSEPCDLCGALTGEYCMYNDTRAAHTRHKVRDQAVMAAAKARALSPPWTGEPVNGPRRRKK